ncbi:uncharacterized protein LOC135156993 [Lytechinus pictus]|uniref:uncharacterized protein LOC135156993 n=1 Tax=Lytechinus pictus TaxID=7653 RepID=UPI0030B9F507
MAGDFNVHVDDPSRSDVKQFLSIIETGSMIQHVNGATHKFDHTLDLVMSRELINPGCCVLEDNCNNTLIDRQIHDVTIHENLLSDHHCVHFCYSPVEIPAAERFRHTVRKFKDINPDSFSSMLSNNLKTLVYSGGVNALLQDYTTAVKECLSMHLKNRMCSPFVSAIRNADVLSARRSRRQAERRWKKHRTDENRSLYVAANKLVNDAIIHAKKSFLDDRLTDADAKTVFSTLNSILDRDKKLLPSKNCSPVSLVTRFRELFVEKIVRIRESHDSTNNQELDQCPQSDNTCSFSAFDVISEENLKIIITKMSHASCSLDVEPTWHLKKYVLYHISALPKVVNASLQSGVFPVACHQALITPVLKKTTLDYQDLKNYRPVSNLSFVAKVIKKTAAS